MTAMVSTNIAIVAAVATALIGASVLWAIKRKKLVWRPNVAVIKQLFIYPVKSLGGIEVGRLEFTKNGAKYGNFRDRMMILINNEGRMITQRHEPRMALVKPSFTGPDELTFTAEGMEPLKVTLKKSIQKTDVVLEFRIWGTQTQGVVVSEDAGVWFSDYLKMPNVKLVQYLKEFEMRPTPVATENGVVMDPNYPTLYQDGHPYHLVSLDTIDSFNRFLPSDKKKVTQANFRANIVTEGSAENDEDRWEFIRMKDRRDGGVVKFKNVKLCTRCVIPTIDQEKGEKDNDLVDIYKRYRSPKSEMEKKNYGSSAIFGNNLVALSDGFLSVGSVLDVTYKDYDY